MPTRRRRRRAFVVGCLVAASVAATRATLAQDAQEERPVVFSLSIDESPLDGCGGAEALTAAVEERLRRSVFTGEDASDITIAIAAERPEAPDTEWHAHIVEKDRADTELGRRDVPLPANDCAKALDTLAVVLAIMIGPARTTTEPPWHPAVPAPAPEPEPELEPPPPKPKPKRKPKARPRPPPPEPLRWEAGPLAGVTGGTGILPGVAFGLEAGAIVRPPVRRLAFVARAAYWFSQPTPTAPPANVDRIGGSVLGCYELFRARALALSGCGGADVSRIEARSARFTVPVERSIYSALLGEARLGYRVPLPGALVLEPYLAPQVAAPLKRDRFTYRDLDGRERTLLFPAAAAIQASLGVTVHFL